MVEEVNLTHTIAQEAIAVDDVEVFLGVLNIALWSLAYLHRHHGRILRTICGGLVMSASLMYTVRLEVSNKCSLLVMSSYHGPWDENQLLMC